MTTLRSRWLGRVPYAEAADLQRALHARTTDDYLRDREKLKREYDESQKS